MADGTAFSTEWEDYQVEYRLFNTVIPCKKYSESDLWPASPSDAAIAGEDGALTERDKAAGEGNSGESPSALSAAVLRIGASLDLDTVLEEVVTTARALTGAGCGAIATVDAAGRPGDFVTSGLTEDEHRALETWPDGPGPLRPSRRPRRTAPAYGPRGVRERARPRALSHRLRGVPGHADAPPRRPCRQLLPRHQGGRVHRGGRGGPGAARRPGRGRGCQCARAPRGAQGPGRPRGAGRDLPGRGGGARRGDRRPRLVQPGGEAHHGGAHLARAPGRAAARRDDLPARRRARVDVGGYRPRPTPPRCDVRGGSEVACRGTAGRRHLPPTAEGRPAGRPVRGGQEGGGGRRAGCAAAAGPLGAGVRRVRRRRCAAARRRRNGAGG